MNKLKFSNSIVAEIFQKEQKVEGSIEENSDGTVTLAYDYSDRPEGSVTSSYEIDEKIARCMEGMSSSINKELSWMNQRIDYLAKALYEHKEGHLPNPQTPSQMQTAIETLGMGEDYEVKKRTIYASYEGKSLEATY